MLRTVSATPAGRPQITPAHVTEDLATPSVEHPGGRVRCSSRGQASQRCPCGERRCQVRSCSAMTPNRSPPTRVQAATENLRPHPSQDTASVSACSTVSTRAPHSGQGPPTAACAVGSPTARRLCSTRCARSRMESFVVAITNPLSLRSGERRRRIPCSAEFSRPVVVCVHPLCSGASERRPLRRERIVRPSRGCSVVFDDDAVAAGVREDVGTPAPSMNAFPRGRCEGRSAQHAFV